MDRATMEVSSTTTTSWRSGFDRVVPEPGPVAAGAPEEPMQRHPAQLEEPLLRARVQVQPECLVAHRFLQPQRRLARRRRQGDERRRGAPGDRLLIEQRQQPGHRRGLSRPRSSGDDRDPAENGGCGGQRLQVVGILRLRVDLAEQRRQAGAQERQVDVASPRSRPGPGALSPPVVRRARGGSGRGSTRTARAGCPARPAGSGSVRRATPRDRATAARRGRSAGRCPCWPSAGWSAGRRTRGRAAAPGRRRRSRGRRLRASPSTPASCAKRCAMWTSALSRIPARLKARRLPDAPAATDAS